MLTRRRLLYSLGGAVAAASYPLYLEPRWLEITESHVHVARDPSPRPVRVLQLSDLHASSVVPLAMIEHAVDAGLGKSPDVICLTGDFITGEWKGDSSEYIRVLRKLSSVAPTFAVMGNHDGGPWTAARGGYSDHHVVERLLKESGVQLLHNRSSRLALRDRWVTFVGVGDLWSDGLQSSKAFSDVNGEGRVVLLAHNPDSKDLVGRHQWDLMLSGHTHGGQVVVPGVNFAPVADKRYVAGLKPWRDRQIHVSRGVWQPDGNPLSLPARGEPPLGKLTIDVWSRGVDWAGVTDPSAATMPKMSSWFRVCACAAAITVMAGQGRTQPLVLAGDVEIAPPAGWSVTRQPTGALVLKRKDNNNLSVILIASDTLKDPLEEAVRRAMRNGFVDADLRLDPLVEGTSIYGHPAVSFDETVRLKQLNQRLRICGIGLDLGGRMQLAWLATVANTAAADRRQEFEQVVRTWRYKNPGGAVWDPAKPRKVPADLAGFYWGSEVRNRYNGLSGGLELKAIRNYVVLLPTGQVYRGVPPGGRVMDMDFDARLRDEPGKCGLYSVQGDTIVFEWPGAFGLVTRKTSPIRKRGQQAGFQFGGIHVSPVPPVSNLRVQGRYTATRFITSNTAFSTTSASSEKTLALTPDGRYTKSGFTGVSFSHDTGGDRTSGAGRSTSGVQAGSYAIDGFQLTLRPDSGPPEYFTIVIETPGPSPGALFINDVAFLKSGR